MDFEMALRLFKAVVILAVTVWETVQLTRRRQDFALRILVVGLWALSFAAVFGIQTPILEPIEDFFGPVWGVIINGCWMVMAYSWAAFFALADLRRPVPVRVRTARVEFVVLVVALAVMALVLLVWPEAQGRGQQTWQRTVFYLSMDGYSLSVWILGICRAGGYLSRLQHPLARAAFALVIVGSAGMTLGVNAISLVRYGIRLVTRDLDLGFMSTLYSIGQLGGQLLLALGLAFAPLAGVVVASRDRYEMALRARYSQQLMPLWRTLTTEFPHIALNHHVSDSGRPRPDDDFERITAEITDGLAELARDCPPPNDAARNPRHAADAVAAGLQRRIAVREARWDHEVPTPIEPPYPVIEPDFDGSWRRRARWMIQLSNELASRGAIRKDLHDTVRD
ncbi:hypothetical protein EIL87_12290 [Saccharopolyspora rhizosphaerae]|uniref:DUF6545 domain-containing protein n=1 Tax=Saccharopolyspora rhizosphaerae TaxID=2492662 RepID=A0A426JV66_9PSEU|nr:MAB_1171c family putative transporter [Saccharopolyspora rhizosphaerae]RRO17046.1 hypothetical protein EIL87_12290 [Saccharopolyspora rhizosphaerae]